MPGVVKVVRDGSYIGVIAQGEWQTVVAMGAMAAAAQWSGGQTLPNPATFFDTIQALPVPRP